MALTVFFVRHGYAENNRDGLFPNDVENEYKLTEKGLEQAKEAAEFLLNTKAEAIFSSPIYRAYQTAKIIGEKLSLEVVKDERLREVELGNLRNKSTKEIFEKDPEWFMEYFNSETVYGLEKYQKIRERMLDFVKDTFEKGYTKVIAVSHLEPIRALLTLPLNINGKEVRKIEIQHASISTMRFEDPDLKEIRILSVGCVPLNRFFA
ncbi:MAG: histidine phosphatase family protein [Nitrososphaeria archaeon]|jgi:probable phosphoglycerate mutase